MVKKVIQFGSSSKTMDVQDIDSLTDDKRKEHGKLLQESYSSIFKCEVGYSRVAGSFYIYHSI